jgi:hypothetical protein
MTRSVLALAAVMMVATSARAQMPLPLPLPLPLNTRGTAEDQRACKGDARKLCRAYIGDDMAVLRCFQSQRPRLSVACRQVLRKYGQ